MKKLALSALTLASFLSHAALDPRGETAAEYAVKNYQQAQIHTLANLVSFPTVNKEGIKATDNPAFIGFKQLLKMKAAQLGLDYQDKGYVVLIGLGNQGEKVTVVTHGDVQPADASKWAKSPFTLDASTEPGSLIARGTEDDKGAIVTALYAMKSIKDKGIKLENRIELMVYLAEESDWDPIKAFLKTYDEPKYAITIDASYPVVVAEKAWCLVAPTFHGSSDKTGLYVSNLKGGAFKSQIPEDAALVLHNADGALIDTLKQRAAAMPQATFAFNAKDDCLHISAKGMSAHSSEPESGVNAIAHLAELFKEIDLEQNADGQAVTFINQLIGLGIEGKQFGDIAYKHAFMGPMTVAPTLLERTNGDITLSINLRRPAGKEAVVLEQEINDAVDAWQATNHVAVSNLDVSIGEPMLMDGAPHAQKLLDVFKHYTGDKDAGFIAIGGSTNAKLFKNAVSFGPSMPGKKYTGHSEHEFITEQQLKLNLRMYTAVMVELGNM